MNNAKPQLQTSSPPPRKRRKQSQKVPDSIHSAAAAAVTPDSINSAAAAALVTSHESSTKAVGRKLGSAKKTPGSAKKTAAKSEKRLARYRASCPKELRDRRDRALRQRMYIVSSSREMIETPHPLSTTPEDVPSSPPSPHQYYWRFAMLGSTGNVYHTCLTHQPTCTCPDFAKRRDLCKHLIFVLVRAVGLETDNPMTYQKAYLTKELDELYERISQRVVDSNNGGNNDSGVWANQQVRSQYAAIERGRSEDDGETKSTGVKRRALDGNPCPICLEEFSGCPMYQVTFCQAVCGMNFHVDCMNQWRRASGNHRQTCPNCRAVEEPPKSAASSRAKRRIDTEDGYVNMGRLQGQSLVRDTSSYHPMWFRRYS